jgi:hypothetical protein
MLLYQHMHNLDSCQQQQQLQQRPATAGAAGSRSPSAVEGWDALRQQSHVLLADNEQLLRDNRLLQKQKEQLQAKVGGASCAPLPETSLDEQPGSQYSPQAAVTVVLSTECHLALNH